jgi:hypothetical protein
MGAVMMISRWRRGVVLASVAAAVVAGVLLATRPWGDDDDTLVQEATAGTVQYRICDVVLDGPLPLVPPTQGPLTGDLVRIYRSYVAPSGVGRQPTLEISVLGLRSTDPVSTEASRGRSVVSIDPGTGALLDARYADASHEASVLPILDTVRVEPLDPSTAPWPYTDAAQIPPQRSDNETFKYRPPDPGSGLVVSSIHGTGHLLSSYTLKVTSCRSVVQITVTFRQGAEPEVTETKDVHPDDEAAFQTFLDEVEVRGVKR